MKLNKYVVICLAVSGLLLGGCRYDQTEYIDHIQVSSDTYVGVSEIATDLDVPWDIQYLAADNSILVTEIKGKISAVDLESKEVKELYKVPNVFHKRTLGLLGMAIHPNFKEKPYVYVCYTTKDDENIYSELLRLHYEHGVMKSDKLLLRVEGASGHNGSRLIFDKKGYLYWATGDAHGENYAQDSTSLNGKVLRMHDDGTIPKDNPIANSYVYAWGFRNIQGLALTAKGHIMSSEHGDAIEDEVNWVRPLHNYGWKEIEGYHDLESEKQIAAKSPRTEPIKAWTPVIAPAGMYYYSHTAIPEWTNSLLLTTLKSQTLRVLSLNEGQTNIKDENIFLKDTYGRIRAVTGDNKGNIYIATSNRDWNPQKGFPKAQDDRILKMSRIDFKPEHYLTSQNEKSLMKKDGKSLYQAYCASCHKADGSGLKGNFPPLSQTETVGDVSKFLKTLLHGLSGKITVKGEVYDQAMPSFNFLSDDEIVHITNYVRSNFGNKYKPIDAANVAENR